jgi:hypothetical protein
MKNGLVILGSVSLLAVGCGGGKSRAYDPSTMNGPGSSALQNYLSAGSQGGASTARSKSLSYQSCIDECEVDPDNAERCPGECGYIVYGTLRGVEFDDRLRPTFSLSQINGLGGKMSQWGANPDLRVRLFPDSDNRVGFRSQRFNRSREMDAGAYDCGAADSKRFFRGSGYLARLDDAAYLCEQGDCARADAMIYQLEQDPQFRTHCGGGCDRGNSGASLAAGGKQLLTNLGEDLKNTGIGIASGVANKLTRSVASVARPLTSLAGGGRGLSYRGCGKGTERACVGVEDIYEYGLETNRYRRCGCSN